MGQKSILRTVMKELLAEGRISRWRGIGEIEIKDVSAKIKLARELLSETGEPIV